MIRYMIFQNNVETVKALIDNAKEVRTINLIFY